MKIFHTLLPFKAFYRFQTIVLRFSQSNLIIGLGGHVESCIENKITNYDYRYVHKRKILANFVSKEPSSFSAGI